MRIAIAGFMQETNSFVPFTTTVKTFEEQYFHRGDELLTAFGSARLEIPGALDVFKEAGATPVPLLATMAMASGTVERKSFDIIMGEIEQRLEAAQANFLYAVRRQTTTRFRGAVRTTGRPAESDPMWDLAPSLQHNPAGAPEAGDVTLGQS